MCICDKAHLSIVFYCYSGPCVRIKRSADNRWRIHIYIHRRTKFFWDGNFVKFCNILVDAPDPVNYSYTPVYILFDC